MRRRDRVSETMPTMTLHAHLKEARTRLFIIFAVFVLFSCGAYAIHDFLLTALLAPLHGDKLAYLNPGGGFSFIFAVTMWAGLALTTPVIIHSIYTFIAPALPVKAQFRGGFILCCSYLLFLGGAAFGYFYAIPGALHFLLGFGDGFVEAMLTADAYLHFVLVYTVGLGIVFQLPIIMMLIHWITPLRPLRLLQFERYVIVGAFVVAAIITPTPDVANQLVVAAPFIGMYQVGLVGVSLSHLRHKRTERPTNRRKHHLPHKEAPGTPESASGEVAGGGEYTLGIVAQPVPSGRYPAAKKSVDGVSRRGVRPAGGIDVAVQARSGSHGVQPPRLRSGQPAMDIFMPVTLDEALDSRS